MLLSDFYQSRRVPLLLHVCLHELSKSTLLLLFPNLMPWIVLLLQILRFLRLTLNYAFVRLFLFLLQFWIENLPNRQIITVQASFTQILIFLPTLYLPYTFFDYCDLPHIRAFKFELQL